MVLGSGGIGDARARVTVDTSDLFNAARDVQRAAEQIRDSVVQAMQGALTVTATTTNVIVAQQQQIQQSIQKTTQVHASATKAATDASRNQITNLRNSMRVIDTMLAEVTAKVNAQQARVRQTTGPGADKSDITKTMREYTDSINEAKVRLRELKTELASVVQAGGDGKALQKQINRLNDIVASFGGGWMDELKGKVDDFEKQASTGNRKAADEDAARAEEKRRNEQAKADSDRINAIRRIDAEEQKIAEKGRAAVEQAQQDQDKLKQKRLDAIAQADAEAQKMVNRAMPKLQKQVQADAQAEIDSQRAIQKRLDEQQAARSRPITTPAKADNIAKQNEDARKEQASFEAFQQQKIKAVKDAATAQEAQRQKDIAAERKAAQDQATSFEKFQKQKKADADKAAKEQEAINAKQVADAEKAGKQQADSFAKYQKDKVTAANKAAKEIEDLIKQGEKAVDKEVAARRKAALDTLNDIEAQQKAEQDKFTKQWRNLEILKESEKRQARERLNSILTAEAAQRRADQQRTQGLLKSAQGNIALARTNISAEQQRFNVAAGSGTAVSKTGVLSELDKAKGPLLDLQRRLQVVQLELQKTLNPAQKAKLNTELKQLNADAQALAKGGFPALSQAVNKFSKDVQDSQTGMRGFFSRLRQELERINEVSLAANIQELSFRLAPLGLAAGALSLRGTQTKMELDDIRISFMAFTNSEEEAVDLMGELADEARRFALPVTSTLSVMQRFSPLLRQAGIDLNSAVNIAARLATLNPAQGIEGALFAMNEALAGQWRSLQTRFNLPTTAIRESIAEMGFVGGLDKFLNSLGRTTEMAEKFGKTSRASFLLAQDALDRFMAVGVDSFVDGTGDAARMFANFLNTLNQTPNAVNQAVGALSILTTALYGVLGVLGQVGLASAGIKAIGTAAKLSIATTPVGSAIAGGVGAVGGLALTASAITAAVALGVATGLGGAAALKVGGVDTGSFEGDLAEQFKRFKQILFTAVSAVAGPFFVGATLIAEAISLINNRLMTLGTVIAEGVQNLAVKITESIRSIGEAFNVELLKNFGADPEVMRQNMQSRFIDANGNVISTPGMQSGSTEVAEWLSKANVGQMDASGNVIPGTEGTFKFVEGYTERIQRLNAEFSDFNLKDTIIGALDEADRQLLQFSNTLGLVGIGAGGIGKVAGNALNMGGNAVFDEEKFATDLKALNDFVIQSTIEQARRQEDMIIQQNRAAEDFWRQRGQQIDDFYAQLAQAEEDYQRSRAERIADFNEQQEKAIKEYEDRRAEMTEDFNREELRRQEDFIRDMRRMSRDIGDALAARDFLAAQNIAQQMADDAEDFAIETARRKEDFERQLADLQDSLDEQQEARQKDFDRQLAREQEQHDRQVQRQIAAFNQQLQREDAQRAIAEQRRVEDEARAAWRRSEDFKRQYDQLVNQNQALIDIHKWGMDGVSAVVRNAYLSLMGLHVPVTGPGGGGGGIGPTQGFATGTMSLPRDMYVFAHQGEAIIPKSFMDSIREGDLSLAGGPRSTGMGIPMDKPMIGEMNIQIDARGLKDFDQREIVEMIADEVVEKMKDEMRKQRETPSLNQWRGKT